MTPRHLVFYDGHCGLCDRVVQILLQIDKNKIFVFAPLQGKTAEEILKGLTSEQREIDSLILVENYLSTERRFFLMGRAALRICWLLGDAWILIGWACFLPSFLFDACYRFVARHRHYFFRNDVCRLPSPGDQDRFLP